MSVGDRAIDMMVEAFHEELKKQMADETGDIERDVEKQMGDDFGESSPPIEYIGSYRSIPQPGINFRAVLHYNWYGFCEMVS